MWQLGLLAFAIAQLVRVYFEWFRYRSDGYYYRLATFKNETNWYSVTDTTRFWGMLIVYGLMAIFQLLTMFGIAPETFFFIINYVLSTAAVMIVGTEYTMRGYHAWITYGKT